MSRGRGRCPSDSGGRSDRLKTAHLPFISQVAAALLQRNRPSERDLLGASGVGPRRSAASLCICGTGGTRPYGDVWKALGGACGLVSVWSGPRQDGRVGAAGSLSPPLLFPLRRVMSPRCQASSTSRGGVLPVSPRSLASLGWNQQPRGGAPPSDSRPQR